MLAYLTLFTTALVAATLLPAQSEAVLATLLASGRHPVAVLIAVATVGNVLGAVINWLLGRGIEHFRDRRWFPVGRSTLEKAQRWYQRFGKWSLLLSWAPFIGDPLTVAAGVMREPLPVFIAIVTVAKLARYLVVAAVLHGFGSGQA
jgi:membrane protein YqaA with SNARE-associated domain